LDILSAIKNGEIYLRDKNISSPRLESEILLAHILGKERLELYLEKDFKPAKDKISAFENLLLKRGKGIPTSYLIGSREFLSWNFSVSPDVLIPRPETELLVEEVSSILKKDFGFANSNHERINIVDLGTGCGVIAVSMAKLFPACFVYAVDISKKALEIAYLNAIKFGVEDRIFFIEKEFSSSLEEYKLGNKIHVIISNPPYIPTGEIKTLQKEVKAYEPITALDGGIDGLGFYREITPMAAHYLVKGGILAFEIGYNQGHQVKLLIEQTNSFEDIIIKKDYAGHERIITAIKK